MKTFLVPLLFILSCAAAPTQQPAYDIRADLDLFLSTRSAEVEAQVLDRLSLNKVSHEEVKSILRETNKSRTGPAGLRLDMNIVHKGVKYPYAVFVPESAGDDYPMIVILHGNGSSGDAIIEPWIDRLHGEFIIVCPSYPMGAWWTEAAEGMILELTRKILAQYPVDYNRVFLAGLSNGAVGAYMTGMFNPDYFAGIVPIAGAITERYMHFLINLNNTPVYMIQGQDDPFFPIEYSRRIYQILSDMKYPVTYREHTETGSAHGGHFLPESEIPALYDWLKTQKRTYNPSIVRMTREENHMGRIQWARATKGYKLAALQIPGPGEDFVNVHDGKIASLFATNKEENVFEIAGQNLLEYELYFDADMMDFDKPVRITSHRLYMKDDKLTAGEKEQSFFAKIKKDTAFMLREFKTRRDPFMVYDAKIKISLEEETEMALNR